VFLVCSFLLFSATFSGSWTMDDFSVIVNNPDIRSVSEFLANTFPGRPLRELSYLVDYFFFGLDPWGYHVQNIFWHGLNCWLIYLLALRIKLSPPVAWISALLFLVHPIHVEVVANSSHRKDSLALVFLLLALLSYMKTGEQKTISGRVTWLAVTIVLWVTAFFAKGNSIVFPALVLAYEYALVSEEKRLIVRWKQMAPCICYAAVFSLVAWYIYIIPKPSFKTAIIGGFVKTENLADFSVSAYILMILKSFAFMVSKLILPVNLSMEYIYSVPKSLFDPWVIMALVLIPLLIATAYRWRTKAPEQFFLLLFSVILWLPTANIVWYFSYFAADRYMYAPSVGLCILAVLASEKVCGAVGRYFVILWILLLGVCSVLTWQQIRIWHNDLNLYTHMLKVSPRSLEAMIGLSNAYYLAKNYETSADYAKMALERDFTDFRPYLILGNINYVRNKLSDALELLLEAQKKNPLSPEVHNALGSVYDDLGNTARAVDSLKTALMLRPAYCEAYTNLGVAYERAADYPAAETALKSALSLNNNHIPAWFSLCVVRYKNNDKGGARTAFSEVLKRDPVHVDALTNLSVVCRELGDDACSGDAERRLHVLTQTDQDSSRH
jgi:tetratricopeptide (TPR) repeat protein